MYMYIIYIIYHNMISSLSVGDEYQHYYSVLQQIQRETKGYAEIWGPSTVMLENS